MTQYCEAKTWSQARSGSWASTTHGCARKAVGQIDGYWACSQHLKKPPANGWNY